MKFISKHKQKTKKTNIYIYINRYIHIYIYKYLKTYRKQKKTMKNTIITEMTLKDQLIVNAAILIVQLIVIIQ